MQTGLSLTVTLTAVRIFTLCLCGKQPSIVGDTPMLLRLSPPYPLYSRDFDPCPSVLNIYWFFASVKPVVLTLFQNSSVDG